ncbi:AdoMet-homocysteine methyltransferase [Kalmusia sp. IMI 367209]|nr:AdoMet-homocysteine methyltransferase [Kalmusia sp. IMI 367209]
MGEANRETAGAQVTDTSPSKETKLSTLLDEGKGVVLDGALATHLETLGADISTALWSASLLSTNPSLIHKTHLTYFQHGAHIAITASYQASFPGLTTHLHISDEEATAIVQKSVTLAQQARSDFLASPQQQQKNEDANANLPLLIAGSVGPYGAFLADGSEYTGSYALTPSALQSFHRGRIAALVAAGVDVLAVETIPSFAETQALVSLLSAEFPATEAWFSFTLASPTHIADGTPIADVVRLLDACSNVVALGANCLPSDLALAGLKEMRRATAKPLIVYPNSGEEWNAQRRDWEGARAGGGVEAEDEGVLGRRREGGWGCCRTGPEDIRAIAETLEELQGGK